MNGLQEREPQMYQAIQQDMAGFMNIIIHGAQMAGPQHNDASHGSNDHSHGGMGGMGGQMPPMQPPQGGLQVSD